MPRRSTADSANPPLLDLHPTLQATLHCMDVRLEDELARYRRARRRSPVQSRWGQGQPMMPSVMGGVTTAPMAETAALAIAPNLAADLDSEPMGMAAGMSQAMPAQPVAPPPEPYGDYLESSEELLRGLAEDEVELRTQPAPRMLDTLLTPLGVGSMVLLLLSSITLGYVITNPTGLPFMSATAPEDEASPDQNLAPSTTADGEDTTAFYPDLSSQEFQDLNLDTLSTLPADGASATPGAPTPAPSPSSGTALPSGTSSARPAAPVTPAPTRAPAPTPASRATSSQPNRTSSPTRTASSPARTASSPRPAAASPRPAASPTRTAASSPRPAASPRPAPAASPNPPARSTPSPVAAAPTAPRPETYYYVVTDYTGDRSLEAARQAVGDAYVRNFEIGAVVQFGAFSEADRAETLIQELQQQGISARVYRVNQN